MSEAKPIASLSSTLLARKGHAKPAMRPQGYSNLGFGMTHLADDLGWNDMGADPVVHTAEIVPITPTAPVAAAPVEAPAVHRQQEEIAREMAPPVSDDPTAEPMAEPVSEAVERRHDGPARLAVIRAIERPPPPRAIRGSKSKAAFTLRLDADRHLKLRLAGAVAHRSSQAIVVEALDAYLDTLLRVTELAREAAHDTKTKDKR